MHLFRDGYHSHRSMTCNLWRTFHYKLPVQILRLIALSHVVENLAPLVAVRVDGHDSTIRAKSAWHESYIGNGVVGLCAYPSKQRHARVGMERQKGPPIARERCVAVSVHRCEIC